MDTKDVDSSRLNLKKLLNPAFYDHPVTQVELVETHISWIFLAGDFAYKLKKPVDFGFLDFSTRAKRQHFCREELRLNLRFAPQLYLAVVTIGGTPEEPELNATPVLEHAVKMKRFPQEQQLDRMLAAEQLTAAHLEKFAETIAEAHQQAARAGAQQSFGAPQAIIAPILQNFSQIRAFLSAAEMLRQVDLLESWSREAHAQLAELFRNRHAGGFIRECHGDIHLGNMAWFHDEPVLFDCIEFNENLRWIDTMNDIAFLIMDLDDHGHRQFAGQFLNRYLEKTGDYSGTLLLNFYKVYRALVRAKVLCLRLSQPGMSRTERSADLKLVSSYLRLASSYIALRKPLLMITHGFSGSGKTSFATQLAPLCDAVCLHSDVERKRLYQIAANENSHSPIAGGIYSISSGLKTYNRLCHLADTLLKAGITVIIDATFIKKTAREQVSRLAQDHQVPLLILDFHLAEDELRRRLKLRSKQAKSVSEAGEEILDYQRGQEDPLCEQELKNSMIIHQDTEVAQIAKQVIKMQHQAQVRRKQVG